MNEYEKLLAAIQEKATKAAELAASDKEEDIAKAEELLTEVEALQAKADRWQKAQAAKVKAEADAKAYQAAAAAPAINDPGHQILTGGEPQKSAAPFAGLGDFLMAVKNAGPGQFDERLRPLKSKDPADENGFNLGGALGEDFVGSITKSAMARKGWKATGLAETPASAGGFLVDVDRQAGILSRVYEVGSLLQRVDMVGISAGSNGMTFNAISETSRADGSRRGGIRAYWTAEGGEKTKSKPEFREMELKLKKVAALVYATDELLADASALESWVMANLPEELRFVVEDSIINGTGVGMPLGIVPGGCVVSVSKEVGQAAKTVVSQNVMKMWSRLYAPCRRNAAWLINQDVEPQLYQLNVGVGTGGSLVFMPPGGLSAAPYATLYGRPVLPIEYCQTLGTEGDIILADMSEYQMIEKGGIQSASSIHVRFVYDESVFRFVWRVDGEPKWNSDLTPFKGTNTQSPFVTLKVRA